MATFENRRGDRIEVRDPSAINDYRNRPGFREVDADGQQQPQAEPQAAAFSGGDEGDD